MRTYLLGGNRPDIREFCSVRGDIDRFEVRDCWRQGLEFKAPYNNRNN